MQKVLDVAKFTAKVTLVIAALKFARAGSLGTTFQSVATTVS